MEMNAELGKLVAKYDQRRFDSIRVALKAIISNDKTKYEHHEPRPSDGRKPEDVNPGDTCWQTPKEIAVALLKELGG